MATLAGKNVSFIGRSSGTGYGVAKAALLSHAAHAVISSSSQKKIGATPSKLQSELYALGLVVEGKVTDDIVNARSSESVKALLTRVGEVEQIVWTNGGSLRLVFLNMILTRTEPYSTFWGAFMAAQVSKIRPDGSITLTVGTVVVRRHNSCSLIAGVMGAIDVLTRRLAVDVVPRACKSRQSRTGENGALRLMATEARSDLSEDVPKGLLVQHVADADEIAEAYLLLIKCGYIMGQRVELDGGHRPA